MHTTTVGTSNRDHLEANVRAAVKGALPAELYAEAKRRFADQPSAARADKVACAPEVAHVADRPRWRIMRALERSCSGRPHGPHASAERDTDRTDHIRVGGT